MVSLDLRTGRRLWEREIASAETPWVAGDWLFVLNTDGQLVAIYRQDGTVAWVTQLDRVRGHGEAADPIRWVGPVLAGDRLVVGRHQPVGAGGQPLHRQDPRPAEAARHPARWPPAVAAGTLYMLTDDAR